jgi:hypothetical protein
MIVKRTLRRLAATAGTALVLTAGTVAATAAPAQAAAPPVGTVVCHASLTVGLQCGHVTATNLTIQFPQGVLTGVFRYTACFAPRDSGIAVFTSTEVVGTVIGGSGNCTVGGVTYALPLD